MVPSSSSRWLRLLRTSAGWPSWSPGRHHQSPLCALRNVASVSKVERKSPAQSSGWQRTASKMAQAVPRRPHADFCNKICQKPTSCSATGRGQSQDEIGLAVASWSCERRGVSYAGILWSAPLASERVERRLTAILAADVAGYSRLTGKDEEGTHTRLREHLRVLIDPKISEHRGRIVKNTGDGMLVEFGSVVECLRCAIEIQ